MPTTKPKNAPKAKTAKKAAPKARKKTGTNAVPRKTGRSAYDVHPGVEMVQQWIATLKEKSGRSLSEWLALIRKSGPGGFQETIAWLKKEHGVGANSAWWMAEHAGLGGKRGEDDTPEGYLKAAPRWVHEQYAGKREPLRPIFESLVALVRRDYPRAKVCPCQTIVPIYREHVIAQIKPTTITRVDLGLALARHVANHKGKLPARLVDTGGLAKKDRITHRIELTSPADIDPDLRAWLRIAWDLDA